MKITRTPSNFTTSVYRKPTFTGLLSKFQAFSPVLYKRNLIATLTYRAYKICSSFLNFHNELVYLKGILQQNGYPLEFIEKQVKKTLNKFYPLDSPSSTTEDVPTEEARPVLFLTYFLGSHSDKLTSDLRDLMKRYIPNIKLRIIFKAGCTIGDFFGFKDKLPDYCLTDFIYKYTCGGCNAFYIGQSARQFKVRVSEHLGVSYRTGKKLDRPQHSEIRDHCDKYHHTIDANRFVRIDKCRYKSDLYILETLHQKIKKPSIGICLQSTPLLSYD